MQAGQWRADPAWRRIDLLSDVHLHAAAPNTFEAWKKHLLHGPADAVLVLGDLFEVWLGDDARHQGFEHECAEVLRTAAGRKPLAFMRGNRDFLVGVDLAREVGMSVLPDPTLARAWGQSVLLSHGDALCLADVDYQRFRAEVRSPAWQQTFLKLPLAERIQRVRAMRQASVQHQAALREEGLADVDAALVNTWLQDANATVLVHGHTHRPALHRLEAGRVRHVLGDWDFDGLPRRARILCWTAQGLEALDLGLP